MGNEIKSNKSDNTLAPSNLSRPSFLDVMKQLFNSVLAGDIADVRSLFETAELGTKSEEERNQLEDVAFNLMKAARTTRRIQQGQIPPERYEADGLRLEQSARTALSSDPKTQGEVLNMAQSLRERVAKQDQAATLEKAPSSSYTPTPKTKAGATSKAYSDMLDRLASGSNLPSQAEVDALSKTEVERLAKRGVPKDSQDAIKSVLDNASIMARTRDKDAAQYGQAKKGFEQAVENKKMWWTVSKEELDQFGATYQALGGGELPNKKKLDDSLKARQQSEQLNADQKKARVTSPSPAPQERRPPAKRAPAKPRPRPRLHVVQPPPAQAPAPCVAPETPAPQNVQFPSMSRDLGISDKAMIAKIG